MNRTVKIVGVGLAVAAAMIVPSIVVHAAEPEQIIGGHEPSPSYAGMASLQITVGSDPDHHVCGATVVFRSWVVVNAHCVTNDDRTVVAPGAFRLRIGSPDRTTGGVVVGVAEVLPHADWDWATGGGPVADIAMLRLDAHVEIQPFEIAVRTATSKPVRLLGWGYTDPSSDGPLPVNLQELDTRLLPTDQCAAAGISVGEICVANQHGTDGPCYGDSGGPALQPVTARRWQLVGGASRFAGDLCGLTPSVYTDLAFYRDWIYTVARTGQVPPASETDASTAAAAAPTAAYTWAGVLP